MKIVEIREKTHPIASNIRNAYIAVPHGGPDGVRVEDRHITMPEIPGIGFEGKGDLHKVMKELVS